jgi:hypothetical protein
MVAASPEQSEEHPDDQLIVDSAGATHEIDDSADDEGDSEELDVSYGHVPSWEEAISYLLNPSLVESVSSAPDSAQSSDHGRPPPRRRGHKRH